MKSSPESKHSTDVDSVEVYNPKCSEGRNIMIDIVQWVNIARVNEVNDSLSQSPTPTQMR